MENIAFRVSIGRWITEGWNLFLRDIGTFAVVGVASTVILSVLFPFVWGPVFVAASYTALRLIERGRVTPQDYLEGYRFFLPALLAGFLITIFSFLGLILLIIPGILIFSIHLFTFCFMSEKGLNFWEAMRASRRVAATDYFGFFMFAVVLGLLNLLGAMFFYVGLVFTLPVSACAVAVAFREAVGLPAAPAPELLISTAPVVIE
ncbi:MAG: hypothetical protein ACR2L2_04475 [Acidobacteriota bacterium]